MKIAFLGDSVTAGCFEIYVNHEGRVDSIRDIEHTYTTVLTNRLAAVHPERNIESKNFGVSGHSSQDGMIRINDVMAWEPDIVIVCYGLNDVCNRSKEAYAANMRKIFGKIVSGGAIGVFMTPNMMNTYVHKNTLPNYIGMAHNTAERQNSGAFGQYLDMAKEAAAQSGLKVCDAYEYWKKLEFYGIDTTLLLCNYINHPTRKMHLLFADLLYDCLKDILL